MADGCTSAGVSCLCILFILNASSTLHVLITQTPNLVTPAYPFNTLIYCFKADGKNEKSLKMFSSFFIKANALKDEGQNNAFNKNTVQHPQDHFAQLQPASKY